MFYDTTNTLFMTSDLLCMTSHPFLGHDTTLCMTSSPLYLTSRPLYLCHHTHPIEDITATTWKVLYAVYLWYHIPYVFDKISTKYDSQHSVLMSPHSAYVWHPLHCRWHRIHSITPNNTIYDVTSKSRITSHITLLYLWHHNLYIWKHIQYVGQHIHYTWDITATICVLTPTV